MGSLFSAWGSIPGSLAWGARPPTLGLNLGGPLHGVLVLPARVKPWGPLAYRSHLTLGLNPGGLLRGDFILLP